MKRNIVFLIAVLSLAIGVFAVQAQDTARLQVIHNAADPAAESVDVYLNGVLLLDDFAFRTATPFIDAPANQDIEIGVAPATSTSASDVIATFTVNLLAGEKYVAIANGVLNPDDFASNPDGNSTGFTVFVKEMAQEEAGETGNVDFAVLHGSTDAPTVDVVARGIATLVDDAPYGAITDYISVPAADYTIDITDATGSVVVASYTAPLSGLAGGAAVVFASGFLNPAANQDGPAFGVLAALPDGTVLELPALTTARLQVIHNAADPAAASVDIYLNGGKLLDDFAFRAATPFIDAPANQDIEIGVAPATSTSASDVIATFTVNLLAGEKYVAIANGVLNPDDFASNPDGNSTGFTVFVKEMAQEEAGETGNVDFAVLHGSTDAPTVDVVARGIATLVDDAPYGAITDYIAVPAADYTIDITDATGSVVVASYTAPLSGLAGGAAVVFASGFLNPAANQDGPAFGVLAALPDGTVLELPALTTARLQVIHNAADPAAASVDIYLNGGKLLDDFAFRAATPFIDAPANQDIEIGVAPGTSVSASDAIATFTVNLLAGEKYVAIANGVLNFDSFALNPDAKSTAFTLFVKNMAQEEAKESGNVDFAVLHGSTDAPTVDVVARDVATLVHNAAYGDITDYISVPAADYTLDVKDSSGTVIVATFSAPLSGLAGGAAVVFASGFLNPAANQDGPAFGVLAALPDGTVLELPALTTARLQVIHNAADPAAESVDVYLNGVLLLDDFAFRTATPFIDAPANQDIEIGVAPGNSSSADDVIAAFPANLTAGKKYIAIANGVLNPNSFISNPDGKATGFTLYINDMAREQASSSDNVDFFVFHGATDAPAVDVVVKNGPTIASNLAYGDMSEYVSVEGKYYIVYLKLTGDPNPFIAFEVPLRPFKGGSAVVLASGFLNPDVNQDGEGFGLIGVLPDGSVVNFPDPPLTDVEGTETNEIPVTFELDQNYPNPFNPTTTISFSLPNESLVKLTIYNLIGQEVATLVNNRLEAGVHQITFDARDLHSGTYLYRIEADNYKATRKMTLLK